MAVEPIPTRRGPYRKGQERREHLLHVARGVFEERGPALTLADVVDASGLSREAVRHYFPSALAVLLALQASYDADSHAGDDDAVFSARLAAAIRTAYAGRGPAALTAILTAHAVIDPSGAAGQMMSKRVRTLRSELTDAIRRAQTAGEFRADLAPEVLATLLLAATQGLATQSLIAPSDDSEVEREAALLRLFEPR